MKTLLTANLLFCLSFVLLQTPVLAGTINENGPASKGTYYVMNPEGLDLKTSNVNSSPTIRTIPYGGKVVLIASATNLNLQIERIQSGLAEVTYNGKTGFVFEALISKFPPPKEIKSFRDYILTLRKAKHTVYYEENRKDWGKHKFEKESLFYLPTENWVAAFLIAQQLFDIPERYFTVKTYDTPGEAYTHTNTEMAEGTTMDELRYTYNMEGHIESIAYALNMEGKTVFISLKYVASENGIEIRQLLKGTGK